MRFQDIRDPLAYCQNAVLEITRREQKRSRDLSWTLRSMPAPKWLAGNWLGSATILAVRCKGESNGSKINETRDYVTSLGTTATALLQHARDRWSIGNSWHWPRDTKLEEDDNCYRDTKGAQVLATLRILDMDALRLNGFWLIIEGLAALAFEITGLLALLAWQKPAQKLRPSEL